MATERHHWPIRRELFDRVCVIINQRGHRCVGLLERLFIVKVTWMLLLWRLVGIQLFCVYSAANSKCMLGERVGLVFWDITSFFFFLAIWFSKKAGKKILNRHIDPSTFKWNGDVCGRFVQISQWERRHCAESSSAAASAVSWGNCSQVKLCSYRKHQSSPRCLCYPCPTPSLHSHTHPLLSPFSSLFLTFSHPLYPPMPSSFFFLRVGFPLPFFLSSSFFRSKNCSRKCAGLSWVIPPSHSGEH